MASYLLDGLIRFKQTIEAVASHLQHDTTTNMLYHPTTGCYYDHTTGLFYNSTSATYLRFKGLHVQQLEPQANPALDTETHVSHHGLTEPDKPDKPVENGDNDNGLDELEAKRAKLLAQLDNLDNSDTNDEFDNATTTNPAHSALPTLSFDFDHHSFAYQQAQSTAVNPMTTLRPASLQPELLLEARNLALVGLAA